MKISEVSEKYNLPAATLRYYEKIGLLENIEKKNGIRNYQDKDLETIHFIICMKKSGFKLEDIITFIKGKPNKRLEMLLKQKEELLKEIKEKEDTLDFLNYKIDIYSNKNK